MLEIVGMVLLFRKLKSMLADKGRGQGLALLGPAFWIAGEIFGAIVGGVFMAIRGSEGEVLVYVFAIVGALVGAGFAVLIAVLVPAVPLPCPACGWQLPPTNKSFARCACPSCQTEVRMMNGVVDVVGPKQAPPLR